MADRTAVIEFHFSEPGEEINISLREEVKLDWWPPARAEPGYVTVHNPFYDVSGRGPTRRAALLDYLRQRLGVEAE